MLASARKLTWALVLVALFTVQVQAQSLFHRSGPEGLNVLLDYAAFAGQSDSTVRLEAYYQVFYAALPFRSVGQIYEAEYEVTLQLIGKDKQPAGSHMEDRVVQVADAARARSRSDYRIGQANFEVPTGKYRLVLILSDKHSSVTYRREQKLNLKSFQSSKPKLSDIELVHVAEKGDSVGSDFSKAGLEIVPSLTGTFGGDEDGRLLFYMEINQGTKCCEDVTVVTSLRHDRHGLIYRDSIHTILEEPITKQLREISLSDFRAGRYELVVELRGRRWKKLDDKKIPFEVPWNQVTLLKHEYKEAVAQLEYIADPGEVKHLKKITAYEERVKAFKEFWASRDPDPSTPVNELKARFYHRVSVANQRFSLMGRQGWRTDRGRILIQFGEPDQVDDYPFAADRSPYQNWHYFEHGLYRKFTFVDDYDNGDYRLMYPFDGLDRRPDF